MRYGGASGQLTMRADSGFYTHAVVAVCRRINVRYSITIRQHKSLHNLIEAIPEDAWTPIPYWMDGAADVAETTCTPFQAEADAAPDCVPSLVMTALALPGILHEQFYDVFALRFRLITSAGLLSRERPRAVWILARLGLRWPGALRCRRHPTVCRSR